MFGKKNLVLFFILILFFFLGFLAWKNMHNSSPGKVISPTLLLAEKKALVASASKVDISHFSAVAGELSAQQLPSELKGYILKEAEGVRAENIRDSANGQTGFLVESTIRQAWTYNQIQNKFMSLSAAAMTSARWLEDAGLVEFSLKHYAVKITWNKDGPSLYSVKLFAIKKI